MHAMIVRWVVTTILVLAATTELAGQTVSLTGRVIDAETGTGLNNATVQILGSGGEQVDGATSGADGAFRVTVPPGAYSVVVTLLGYGTRRIDVRVDGESDTITVALASQAIELNPIVVSASREEEKALEAPATVAIVGAEEIEDRPAPTAIEHVKGQPGVDVSQTGLQQAHVVTRGFNNVFSGAMLVITDNRYAHVPSLRVNVYSFIPVTNHDLDRIELVLGPGAALYGPNAANGVMHMITTSPITAPGTTVSLAGGERAVVHGEFRHAHRADDDKWGIRVSGQYFRGEDWKFTDPAEEEARAANPTNPRIGDRDFDAERYNADVRFDVRPWEDGELIFAGGLSHALSQIELTGIGAAQAKDWRYSYGQVRARKGRLFVQGFGNFSNAGDTFLLRTGQEVVDESFLLAGQVQHGLMLADRVDLIYGVDLQRAEPRTDETITGRFEGDDVITEIGGYAHADTRVTDQIDVIGALRLDYHNRLEDPVYSPRAALVFEPVPDQNLRLTFNRAFSTPTTNNLFLDIIAGRIPITSQIGFDVRTLGSAETGLSFSESCPGGIEGRPAGPGSAPVSLCMFSPFAAGQLPANAALAYNALLQAVVAAVPDPATRAQLQALLPVLQSPDPAVQTVLRRFDPEGRTFVPDPDGPQDIARLQPTITNTIELGYKGLIGGRMLLAADVYRSDIEDFIGPLKVETSTVFLEPGSVAAFLTQRLTPLIQAGQLPAPLAQAIVDSLTRNLARIPIGTIAPDENPTSDIVLAYRNFGNVDLWGADFSAEVLVSDRLTIGGTYSFVSDDCFDFSPGDGETCQSAQDVALNAPKNKGSLMARWKDEVSGWSFGGRARFVSDFPMNSGVYVGDVGSYTVVDANVGYRLPWMAGAAIQLQVYNLFDEEHQEFVGAPEIGRLALLRLVYDMR
jgi:outer membrane receptor for ferrienterochelin and colicins